MKLEQIERIIDKLSHNPIIYRNNLETKEEKEIKKALEKEKRAVERAKNAVHRLNMWIDYYEKMDVDKVELTVSKGNKKIGNTLNVSLAPVLSCPNCKECMKLCYDIKAVLQYTNVAKARAKNLVLLKKNRQKYFDSIRSALNRRKKNKYFRWHVAGDIIDIDYFDNMVKIAREYPDFKFWTYTKSYGIVNLWCKENGRESIPKNLSVMFSEWRGMKMNNPYHFPEFKVVFKNEPKPKNVKWCCGDCNKCIKNNSHCVKGETVHCMEH